MKRNDPYLHTRGQWKHNELAWAVLVVLYVTEQKGLLPLRVKVIQEMTGCNYKSLVSLLPKWVEFGWIKRNKPLHCQAFVKPVYTYSITEKGKRRLFKMEMPRQHTLFTFQPGVDRKAILKRLPLFNETRYKLKE